MYNIISTVDANICTKNMLSVVFVCGFISVSSLVSIIMTNKRELCLRSTVKLMKLSYCSFFKSRPYMINIIISVSDTLCDMVPMR